MYMYIHAHKYTYIYIYIYTCYLRGGWVLFAQSDSRLHFGANFSSVFPQGRFSFVNRLQALIVTTDVGSRVKVTASVGSTIQESGGFDTAQ